MAETETIRFNTTSPPPLSESDNSTEPPTMTETRKESDEEKKPGLISLRIWPPTQKTRDAVVNRLIETLTNESIFSKRYGNIESEEALTVAKSIEEEAYVLVGDDGDGIEILEAYTKEISKRVLDSVKTRISNPNAGNGAELATESGEDEKAPVDSA